MRRWFWLCSTALILVIVALVGLKSLLDATLMKEWNEKKAALSDLVSRHASKDEAIRVLGTNYVDYSRGTTNELILKNILDRETYHMVAVREKVAKWPNVLFTSSIDVQSWVFLDRSNRVVDFVLSAQ